MQKPEYLTGEALTIAEKLDKTKRPILSGESWSEICHWVLEIAEGSEFKNQPFTKDMIVRPEKPNKKTNNLNAEIVVWEGWQPLFKGEWSIEGVIILYKGNFFNECKNFTVNDFIREAKKAGINLEWC